MNDWDGGILLTDHAVKRSQARGISLKVIELTARYGMAIRAPGGVFKRRCTKDTIRDLKSMGLNGQMAEKTFRSISHY